jgi:hypothetical protein
MLETEGDEDVVRLWWWPPGQGLRCQRVLREDLDQARLECQEIGAACWITGAFVLRCD